MSYKVRPAPSFFACRSCLRAADLEPVCCGWPLAVLLSSAGLGAAFHTRFGGQDCQRSRAGRAAAPAGGPLPPEAMDEEAGEPDVPAAP